MEFDLPMHIDHANQENDFFFKTKTFKRLQDHEREISGLVSLDYLQSNNKLVESMTTALIPPWLRNKVAINSGIAASRLEEKSYCKKKRGDNNFAVHLESPEPLHSKDATLEVSIDQEVDKLLEDDKTLTKIQNRVSGERSRSRGNVTSIDVVMAMDKQEAIEAAEKKKAAKIRNQSKKTRKRSATHNNQSDIELLLERKAKEVLDSYLKKEARNASPDNRNFIGKSSKFCTEPCEDIRLVQDSKKLITNKEDLNKWVENLRENHIAGLIVKNPEGLSKYILDGVNRNDNNTTAEKEKAVAPKSAVNSARVMDVNANTGSCATPEEEDEIKKIDELLSKTRTSEEKLKYLEQLKKHFEKKKRSNVARHIQLLEDNKSRKRRRNDNEWERENHLRDKIKLLNPTSRYRYVGKTDKNDVKDSNTFRKSAVANDVTGHSMTRALNAQFTNAYGSGEANKFTTNVKGISPKSTALNDDNELRLQSKAYDAVSLMLEIQDRDRSRARSQVNERKMFLDSKGVEKSERFCDNNHHACCDIVAQENTVTKDVADMLRGREKWRKNPFKTKIELKSPRKDTTAIENDKMENLNKDFSRILEVLRSQMSTTNIQLQSVTFECIESESSVPRKIKVVQHNSAQGPSPKVTHFKDSSSETDLNYPVRDGESQTENSGQALKLNTRVQTQEYPIKEVTNFSSQTNEISCAKVGVQTETVTCIKTAVGNNIPPGLYRLSTSREKEDFILHPVLHPESQQDVGSLIENRCLPLERGNPDDCFGNRTPAGFYMEKRRQCRSCTREGTGKKIDRKPGRCLNSQLVGLKVQNSEAKQDVPTFRLKGETSVPCQTLANKRRINSLRKYKSIDVEIKDRPVSSVSSESECTLLWNGQKMNHGSDLKVHVEDLVLEKLQELIATTRKTEGNSQKEPMGDVESRGYELQLEKNSAMPPSFPATSAAATQAEDSECFASTSSAPMRPFVFSGKDQNKNQLTDSRPAVQESKTSIIPKSFREIGTQNSRHTILSLSVNKPKAKMFAIARIKKAKWKKCKSIMGLKENGSAGSCNPISFNRRINEAKKVKLEMGDCKEVTEESSHSQQSTEMSSSHSSSDCALLNIPISARNTEDKKKGRNKTVIPVYTLLKNGETIAEQEENGKVFAEGMCSGKKSRNWELIENVINRISDKEQEKLWTDVKNFIKGKIGRDINGEGAREVCIEIVQDVPKSLRGKGQAAAIAKGNYAQSKGDVEVEVDLTLDDLERIIRHRRKKWKKHSKENHNRKQISRSSHVRHKKIIGDVLKHPAYVNCSKTNLNSEYLMLADLRMLKEKTN